MSSKRNFVLKIADSGIPFIMEYKQALLESGKKAAIK